MSYDGLFHGNKGSVKANPEPSTSIHPIEEGDYGRKFLENDEAHPSAAELDSPHKVITGR
jgi:hypothetical protein